MPALLSMRGLSKSFGPTRALDGVSLEVHAGEVHALVGENGAGKSTWMKILSGAQFPDRGEMFLVGNPYAPRHPGAAREAGVFMLYQELSLAPHLSITDNIFLGRESTRGPWLNRAGMRQQALAAMEQAGLGGISPETPVRSLSAAQCQQVELARALASGCRVLVLDEPTSSLSRPEIDRLFDLIRAWKSAGLAIVYISHFLEEIREIADTCTVLCDGRVVRTDPMAKLSDADIVRAMVGREVSELYPRTPRQPGDIALSVREPQASFDLHRGEIFGIAGLIGSGRTELLRDLFGLSGKRGDASPAKRWRSGVGMVSEDRKREGLALNLSVSDNMTLSRLPRWSRPRRQLNAAQRWVERLHIKCASAAAPVQSLSGGNQQKIALARLLYHEAGVWLLDEPTRGIDVAAKAQIYACLDDLASGRGQEQPCAILLVSSYLPELLGLCDRIAVMRRGVLGEARPVGDWSEHSLMEEALR